MTKKDWESSLCSGIKKLPQVEIDKVLEYYSEIFYDKMDEGKSEIEILKEFGNPYDIAYKIYYDYCQNQGIKNAHDTSENKEQSDKQVAQTQRAESESFQGGYLSKDDTTSDTVQINGSSVTRETKTLQNEENSSQKSVWELIGRKILFFVPYVIFVCVVWSIILSFAVCAISFLLVSPVGVVIAILTASGGSMIAIIGMLTVLFGVGILFAVLTVFASRLAIKPTVMYFYKGKHLR